MAETPDPDLLARLASEGGDAATVEIDLDHEPFAPTTSPPDMEWGASPNGPVVQ